jgi:hypothetical protein
MAWTCSADVGAVSIEKEEKNVLKPEAANYTRACWNIRGSGYLISRKLI